MHGVSGFEAEVAQAVAELFAPYVDEVSLDALGSVIAVKKSKKENAKRVMLDAHIDEIGLMVTSIDEKGFLKFTSVGGVDERILPAREVVVHGKRDIAGIIGIKPPHLQSADENKKTLKIDELAIDVGMDEKAVRSLVAAGDWVTFSQECAPLLNGQMTGKSFDDRASVCALLYAAPSVSGRAARRGRIFCAFRTGGNEPCWSGVCGLRYRAGRALVIDVTHAKTPDNADCPFDVGGGVAYSLGPNVHAPVCASAKGAGGGARRRRKGGGRRREHGHERVGGAGEPDRRTGGGSVAAA